MINAEILRIPPAHPFCTVKMRCSAWGWKEDPILLRGSFAPQQRVALSTDT